jgi:hypothetical protein
MAWRKFGQHSRAICDTFGFVTDWVLGPYTAEKLSLGLDSLLRATSFALLVETVALDVLEVPFRSNFVASRVWKLHS